MTTTDNVDNVTLCKLVTKQNPHFMVWWFRHFPLAPHKQSVQFWDQSTIQICYKSDKPVKNKKRVAL